MGFKDDTPMKKTRQDYHHKWQSLRSTPRSATCSTYVAKYNLQTEAVEGYGQEGEKERRQFPLLSRELCTSVYSHYVHPAQIYPHR